MVGLVDPGETSHLCLNPVGGIGKLGSKIRAGERFSQPDGIGRTAIKADLQAIPRAAWQGIQVGQAKCPARQSTCCKWGVGSCRGSSFTGQVEPIGNVIARSRTDLHR